MNISGELAVDIVENTQLLAIAEFTYDGILIDHNKGFHTLFAIFLSDNNYWKDFFVEDISIICKEDGDLETQLLKTTKGDGLICSLRMMESTFYCIGEMLELKDERLIAEISDLSNVMARLNSQLRREKQQLIKAYKEIERISREDPLTCLLNRRAFFDVINPKLSLAKRQGMHITVFFIDIDYFKSVNDNWGHDMGDTLLIAIADMLKNTLRLEDTISRFGGEEFVIVLTGQSLKNSLLVAKRILKQCRAIQIESLDRINTLSIGVAQWDGQEGIHRLITRADNACYSSKESGRDRYTVSAPDVSL